MRTGSVLFLLGILLLVSLPVLLPERVLWCTPACLALLSPRRWLRWPAFVLAGFLFAHWRAVALLAQELDPAWEGRTLAVTGMVASLPERKGGVVRFNFRIDHAPDGALPVGTRVRLGWYRGAPPLAPGER